MRVNMDSSIATDPAFRLVAMDLGADRKAVIGACFLVWLACYERRSERLSKREADVVAELEGFAEAMIANGLADDDGAGNVAFRGVGKRIEFLQKQAERGAKGGRSKGSKRSHSTRQANAKQMSGESAQTAKANTPTPAPDLPLAPAPLASASETRARVYAQTTEPIDPQLGLKLGMLPGWALLEQRERELLMAHGVDAGELWAEAEAARAGLGLQPLRETAEHLVLVANRLAAGFTPDDCRRAIANAVAEVRLDPAKGQYFAAGMWRPENFERRLAGVGAERPKGDPRVGYARTTPGKQRVVGEVKL